MDTVRDLADHFGLWHGMEMGSLLVLVVLFGGPVLGLLPRVSLTNNTSAIIEGCPVMFTCKAFCLRTTPVINWYLEDTVLTNSTNDVAIGTIRRDHQRPSCVDISKTLTLTPNRSHAGLVVRCQVLSVELNHSVNKDATLETPVPRNRTTQCNVTQFDSCPPEHTALYVRSLGSWAICVNCTRYVSVGDSLDLKCAATGSNPRTHLEWELTENDDGEISPFVLLDNSSSQCDNASAAWDSVSEIRIQINTSFDGSLGIVCRVLYPDVTTTFKEENLIVLVRAGGAEDADDTWKLVAIGCSSAAGFFIVLFLSFLTVKRVKRKRMIIRYREQQQYARKMLITIQRQDDPPNTERPATTPNEVCETTASDLEFPRHRVRLREVIGSGNFAQVHKAVARGIVRDGEETTVAVKIVRGGASPSTVSEFKSELAIFQKLEKHPYVVSFLGCCTTTAPFYLIMEYVPNGTLESYIQQKRTAWSEAERAGASGREPLSAAQVLMFAFQVANGMEYVSSMHLVHRDLATRNVLLGEGLICKLCDFGLARNVGGTEQYNMISGGAVPVRWLALESLLQNIYTTKSDVWSFGVLLWELVTLGAMPYPDMSPDAIIDCIKQGFRLPQPAHCGSKVYKMMVSCWKSSPRSRPNFTALQTQLDYFLKNVPDVLNMSRFVADVYVYPKPKKSQAPAADCK